MKKITNILLIVIILFVISLAVLAPFTFFNKKHPDDVREFTDRITISDQYLGKVDPSSTMISKHIEYEDDYTFEYSWVFDGTDRNNIVGMDPAQNIFLTSIVITDEHLNPIYNAIAGSIMADATFHLEPGTYYITFTHYATRESFVNYAKEYICPPEEAEALADDYDFENFVQNGEYNLNYYLKFSPRTNSKMVSLWIALFSVMMLIVLVLICVSLSFKKKNLPDFDERQELIRGKAYKTGFYATLLLIALALIFDSTGSLPFLNSTLLYGTTILGGVLVFAVYCVWNEAYFGLNQKTSSVMFILAFIGIMNLFIGIINFVRGSMIVGGKLTFNFMNFICAFMFIVLFITMLLKKITNKVNDELEKNEPIDDED